MFKITALTIALIALTACAGPAPWTIPDGITCPDNPPLNIAGEPIESQPPEADPESPDYDPAYSAGYYAVAQCDVSDAFIDGMVEEALGN